MLKKHDKHYKIEMLCKIIQRVKVYVACYNMMLGSKVDYNP